MASGFWEIRDWDAIFETSETRKLKRLSWVPMPNKHDGRGFRRVMARKDGLQLMGAFGLIAEVASRMPVRGRLMDREGPLTAEDIALKLGAVTDEIQSALDVLSSPEIKWISWNPLESQRDILEPQPEGKEGKEGKGKKGMNAAAQQKAAAAANREGTAGSCERPSALEPCESPDLDDLAGSLASDLAGHHAQFQPGRLHDARILLERVLASSANPAKEAAAIRESHRRFRVYWSELRAKRPNAFVPQLPKWIQDGDYLHPPGQAAVPTESPPVFVPNCVDCQDRGSIGEAWESYGDLRRLLKAGKARNCDCEAGARNAEILSVVV